MTRENTAECNKVMQAYVEGKPIQYADAEMEDWIDIESPDWNWDNYDYRVKPEPKYRHFANAEECLKGHSFWCKSGGIIMKQEYIIDKELKDMFVSWFENIEEISSKLTSGNVSHQGATIRNKAIRCSKFIKEHCKTKEE